MNNKNKHGLIVIATIALILTIDQVFKIWVKTNMYIGEQIEIFSWFKIYFVENNGMAFGLELGGKLFLTLFRIVAIGFIGYFLYNITKKDYPKLFLVSIAFIFAGTLGNVIDCVFYGQIFSESNTGVVAQSVSFGEGYAPLLYGKVVDMLSFPLFSGTFPSWFPKWGGESFTFFSPIFNIADSAITVGVFILLVFFRKLLSQSLDKKETK